MLVELICDACPTLSLLEQFALLVSKFFVEAPDRLRVSADLLTLVSQLSRALPQAARQIIVCNPCLFGLAAIAFYSLFALLKLTLLCS